MRASNSLKVVIADDAPFIREVLNAILSRAGHQVVGEAENGEQAVQLSLQKKPDLVIMDIVMPIKSGIQATKEILEQRPQTKILACSTANQEVMLMKAVEAGAHDFIHKPFKGEQILQTISKVFGGQTK